MCIRIDQLINYIPKIGSFIDDQYGQITQRATHCSQCAATSTAAQAARSEEETAFQDAQAQKTVQPLWTASQEDDYRHVLSKRFRSRASRHAKIDRYHSELSVRNGLEYHPAVQVNKKPD